jgi:hypothetical protein
MDQPQPIIDPAETPSHGHEVSDVRLRPVLSFGVGMLVIALVVLFAMAWMFQYFAGRQARLDVPGSPVAERRPPPEPRLQTAPAQDLNAIRAAEDAVLSSYGWSDRQAGIVRIPIDRAMELLAERGLPVRGESRKRQ